MCLLVVMLNLYLQYLETWLWLCRDASYSSIASNANEKPCPHPLVRHMNLRTLTSANGGKVLSDACTALLCTVQAARPRVCDVLTTFFQGLATICRHTLHIAHCICGSMYDTVGTSSCRKILYIRA